MVKYFDKIIDVKFTAGLEKQLDEIGAGNRGWVDTIRDFYSDFEKLYNKAETSLEGQKVKVPVVETDVVCDKCGRKMVVKSGRFGKFLACPGYPECKNTKPMPEDEVKQPCPKCGGKLVKKISKRVKSFTAARIIPIAILRHPEYPRVKNAPNAAAIL